MKIQIKEIFMKKTNLLIFIVAAVVLLEIFATDFAAAQGAAAAPEAARSFFSLRAGFFQIIIYLLCICVIFKSVEICQIALMSNSDKKATGIMIGVVAIIISFIITMIVIFVVNALSP